MNQKTIRHYGFGNTNTIVKYIATIVVITLVVIAARRFDIQILFRDALTWISGLGPVAPLFFVALYIMACILLLPGSILTLGAGVVIGAATSGLGECGRSG